MNKGLVGAIKYSAIIGAIVFLIVFSALYVAPVFAFGAPDAGSPVLHWHQAGNESIVSGGEYSPLKNYGFAINATNGSAYGIYNCTFYTNITGIWWNYTSVGETTPGVVNISSSIDGVYDDDSIGNTTTFTINFTQEQTAGAGAYYYAWVCNDTNGQWNFSNNISDAWTNPYTIAQNSSYGFDLYIDGAAASATRYVGNVSNISTVIRDTTVQTQNLTLELYGTTYNLTHQTGNDGEILGIRNNTYQEGLFTVSSPTIAKRVNLTLNTSGHQNYSSNETGVSYNVTLYGFVNLSCIYPNFPADVFRTTVGSPLTVTCFGFDNTTSAPIPNYNISYYNHTGLIAENMTNSVGTAITVIPGNYFSTAGVYIFNTTIANNATDVSPYTNTFYNYSPLVPNNITKLLYVTSLVNPRPLITNSTNISTNFTYNGNWSQPQNNYSFKGVMTYSDFTGGTFNGVVMANDKYAPLTYSNRRFWEFPTREEFLSYNLTFQANFTAAANYQEINVTPITLTGQVTGLYKNQTLLPASWRSVSPPISQMMNGTTMPTVLTLAKNPGNFSVAIYNMTGFGTIGSIINLTGCGMDVGSQTGTCPNASFVNGKLIMNLSGGATTNYTISLMMGLQDMTCIDEMLAANANQWSETLFNTYCNQDFAPSKIESSPVFIQNQTVVGTNPFSSLDNDLQSLNESGNITFVLNVTNTLLNYTGDNIFIEYQIPINMTSENDSTTFNMTDNHVMGYYNTGTSLWQTITTTSAPIAINQSEGCIYNFTDQLPGSPTYKKNMTMCFRSYIVNLSQEGISESDGWTYNDVCQLNLSMTNSFSILNTTTAVTGGGSSLGDRGNTSTYNFTVGGQQGLFEISTSVLPGISGSAGATACRAGSEDNAIDGTCDNITVYVNGQTYYNWTAGSIILNSQQTGVQTVSIIYSVPALATTTTPSTPGGGLGTSGGFVTGTNETNVTANETEEAEEDEEIIEKVEELFTEEEKKGIGRWTIILTIIILGAAYYYFDIYRKRKQSWKKYPAKKYQA